MLVGVRELVHGMDMHATLVRKGAATDERLAAAHRQVGGLVHVARQLREMVHRPATERLVALFLELQIREDGDQIRVAATFADPVDGSLHVIATGIDGCERVGRR